MKSAGSRRVKTSAIPATVLERARAVQVAAKKPETTAAAPKQGRTKARVIAALKKLHPMD